jgi:hypothetical protein
MVAFFKKLPATVIGIEACGASHYLARLLQSLGPPQVWGCEGQSGIFASVG